MAQEQCKVPALVSRRKTKCRSENSESVANIHLGSQDLWVVMAPFHIPHPTISPFFLLTVPIYVDTHKHNKYMEKHLLPMTVRGTD